MMTTIKLSIYGLLIRDQKVLTSSEEYKGHHLVKYPGGSVEYGEGLHQALIREWEEEVQVEIEIGSLIYLTEDFLPSAFRKERQIVSFIIRCLQMHRSSDERRSTKFAGCLRINRL